MTVTAASRRESRCDFGVSHTTPTRPDPTRPINNYPRSGFHHIVTYVTRGLRDVVVEALTRPDRRSA